MAAEYHRLEKIVNEYTLFTLRILKLTYNPEGIVFDLFGEALVLINPPVDAILAGVVWKYCLSWPHLRGRVWEECV